MKKLLLTITIFTLIYGLQAQNVGIGTNTPNASAKLDVTATDKGFLPPRVNLTATNATTPITSPATGLLVYNQATAGTVPNNVTPGYYYWDGSKWTRLNLNSKVAPLYIRGTGLNNNSARVLRIGDTQIYSTASGRGLRLTIISKSTHAVLTDATYDSYGNVIDANNLATALNGINNGQIGILTSYDAWEGAVTSTLEAAFKRLGLYKALLTPTGSRRPYAAIFEGSSNSSVPSASAVEVEHSGDANQPYAEIRGWLIDGSFVATTQIPSGLATPVGEYAVGVDEAGNVGIGTTNPTEKLQVEGNVLTQTIRSVWNASNTETVSINTDLTTKRYHVSTQYQGSSRTSVPLDMTIMNELCGDEDGCEIRFLMKKWDSDLKTTAAARSGLFFYDTSSGRWRLSTDSEGIDGDNNETHIYNYWGCYFTDHQHINSVAQNDGTKQLYLLTWDQSGTNANKTCEMVIDD
ncbi:MAG: hypothetical protein H6578_05115 [Chitinophagales bacterium]|nr:hypothetical protein [Chitinophagales bacterium]